MKEHRLLRSFFAEQECRLNRFILQIPHTQHGERALPTGIPRPSLVLDLDGMLI